MSTADTETARALCHALIDELKQRGTIKAERIEAAFRAVPRHLFLPGVSMEEVYQDAPIITKRVGDQPTSSSSQPGVMASMLEQLDVQPGQRILEIGAGTGYNAALLAYLAGPEGQITTIDLDQDIVDGARARLAVSGFGDIEVICGDGWQGYPANAPYDGIIVTAGVEDIAPAWWDQLTEGGRLVVPLALLPRHLQPVFPWTALITFRKTAEQLISVSVENCGFLPLRGPSAHPLPAPVSLSEDVTVALADEYQGDRTALALAVNAPGTDVVANVEAAPGELVGLASWLALCDRNACALSARSSWYGTGVQPYLGLRSGEETLQVTIGSASAAGLAVMLGRPVQAGPDDETSQVVVRRFGSDATLVPRLLDCIHGWDRAGRPFKYASFVDVTTGDPALRIRAYPPHSPYPPAADELSVQKAWARLAFDFGAFQDEGRGWTNARAPQMLTLEQLYTSTPESEQFEQELEQSLHPRGWDMLLDMVREAGLRPGSKIVDVGCGTGYWACQLVERLDAKVLAIDVVPNMVAAALERVKAAGLEQRVVVREAAMHAIPVESESCDLVWCRDMLNHIQDLASALQECCRVLRPGGAMLVYQTFAGELLEPREAARLYRALGIVPENMSTEHVEHAFAVAGLSIMKQDVIASEWREEEVERGERTALEGLLHAARLLRRRHPFIEKYGEARYEQALGDAQWYPFIMLGKLMPVAYLLRKGVSEPA